MIIAAPRQHGIVHTNTSLNCTSALDAFQDMLIYKWFRGYGESKEPLDLEGSPEFVSVNHSHQGFYTCQVYISSLDIRIDKVVEFLVTGTSKTLIQGFHTLAKCYTCVTIILKDHLWLVKSIFSKFPKVYASSIVFCIHSCAY